MADQVPSSGSADSRPPLSRSEGTERVRDVIRDSFYTMLGAASWAFEKTDEMTQSWLRQGRSAGDESRRRFDDLAGRTRQAGEDFSRRVQDSVRSARSSMPLATREQVASLERQVAQLTREIEAMRAQGSTTPSTTGTTRPPRSS